jgi:hypothetical protein
MNHAEQNNQENRKNTARITLSLSACGAMCAWKMCDNRTFRRSYVGQFV